MSQHEPTIDRYERTAPLVIALHGAVANRKTWLPLLHVLSPEISLWAPDLPGHGARANEPFRLASALVAIDEVLVAARQRPIILIGDSLGGYLALIAAAHTPVPLVGVVVSGCTFDMHGLCGLVARLSDIPPRIVERVMGTDRMTRTLEKLVERFTDERTAAAIVGDGLRLASRSESLRELRGINIRRSIAKIAAPITFLNGAHDWPTRASERAFAKRAQHAVIDIVPKVGHGVGLVAPGAFARVIHKAFLTNE